MENYETRIVIRKDKELYQLGVHTRAKKANFKSI